MRFLFVIIGLLCGFNSTDASTNPSSGDVNNRILLDLGDLNNQIIEAIKKATSLAEALKQINGQYGQFTDRTGIERPKLAELIDKVNDIPSAEFTLYEEEGAGSKIAATSNIDSKSRKIKAREDSAEEDEAQYIINQLKNSSNGIIQLQYFEVVKDPVNPKKTLLKPIIAFATKGKSLGHDYGKKIFCILRAPAR